MRTRRDKDIEIFLENNKAISTVQANKIFFNGDMKSCSRRLNELEDREVLTHYYIDKNKVYKLLDEERDISKHDLYVLDLYAYIYEHGGEVLEFIKTPQYFNRILIPDALLKFKIPYEGDEYIIDLLLEVDYTHFTPSEKLIWYEKLYRENVLKDFCDSEFPFLLIARPREGIRTFSNNFNVRYCDLKFNNLLRLLLE